VNNHYDWIPWVAKGLGVENYTINLNMGNCWIRCDRIGYAIIASGSDE
jgi:hypothetical protein